MIGRVSSFLRIVRSVSHADAADIGQVLGHLWLLQMASVPDDFKNDLLSLGRFFDPATTGGRLRKELSQLQSVDESLTTTLEPYMDTLALQVGHGRWLVTPEGRAFLEIARVAGRDVGEYEGVVAQLADVYSDWAQGKARAAAALLRGDGPPMRPMSLGLLMFLVVNRNTGLRPLPKPATVESEGGGPFAEALDSIVGSFAAPLVELPPTRNREESVLGWPLSEARRRLPAEVRLADYGVWIEEEEIGYVVSFVASDLVARRGFAVWKVEAAFDSLQLSIHNHRGILAAYSALNERSSFTIRVRSLLLESVTVKAKSDD
jgi:hypothetical protein